MNRRIAKKRRKQRGINDRVLEKHILFDLEIMCEERICLLEKVKIDRMKIDYDRIWENIQESIKKVEIT